MNDEIRFAKPDEPGKWASIVLTVAVHLGLIAFLVFGLRWQSAPHSAMQVDLVAAPTPARAAPPPKPEPKAEPPKPQPKPEPPKPEPKPEPKPAPKPEIATKSPEPKKPEPKKPEPKPEPKKPEPKPEPKKPEPKKLEPKPEAKQPEPKKPAPKPEKPREVVPPKDDYMAERLAQATERAQLERMMRDDAARAAAAKSAAAADAYVNAIRSKVRGNLLRPPGLAGNPEAVFEVDQLPSGEVLAIRLKRSSGVPALDEAIERAIMRSSPLPLPQSKELFERTLELRFRPLEDG